MSYKSIIKKEETTTPNTVNTVNTGYKSILKNKPTTQKTPTTKTSNQKTKISTLPKFLGGGAYNTVIGEPETLLKTPRGYAGVKTTKDSARHHIIPVEFGGDSTLDKNIISLGNEAHDRITKGERLISSDYNSGKISLGEARVKIMGLLQKEQDEAKGITTSVTKNFVNIIKENVNKIAEKLSLVSPKVAGYTAVSKLGVDLLTKAGVYGKEEQKKQAEKWASPEYKLERALKSEKNAEINAKIITAPIRFTVGSLATLATSYALEKADSNDKYTPKTDAEKLIIGDVDIQRLTKQEDLYGTIARVTSIPVALTIGAILENPFLQGTGISKGIKSVLEKQIAKQGEKYLSRLGTKEIIRLADDAIKSEVKAGKIEKEAGETALKEIKGIRIKPVAEEVSQTPIVEPQKATGEVLTPKTTKVSGGVKDVKTNPLNFKTAEDYVKAQPVVYHGTPEKFDNFNLEQAGKSTDSGMFGKGFYFTDDLKEATTYSKRGNKVGEVKEVVLDLKKPYIIKTKADIPKIDVPMDTIEQMKVADKEYSRLFTEKLQKQGYDGVIDIMSPGSKQYVVFNPKQIKTKSQLISEWNKAHTAPKTPIKYIPEKKPVDLRKKITTERLIAEPSIPNRIKDSAIEKGLKADFGGISDYDKVSFKDQAIRVGQIIDEDPEKAIRIALGKELPTNGALPESVFNTVWKQAEKNGDTDLLIRLATEEGGIAKESTVLGQRIKMLDDQAEFSSRKAINEVVKSKNKAFEAKKGNINKSKKKEFENIKNELKKVKPKVDDWSAFLDEIKCNITK